MKKRVLYIHMNFYEYDSKIVEEIEKRGHEVERFCDKAPDSFYERVVKKYRPDLFRKRNYAHQQRFLNRCEQTDTVYDIIFVIVGRYLTPHFYSELKRLNPAARFVAYLWDDVNRIENAGECLRFHDIIYTFDPKDARRYGYRLLPLFYTRDFLGDRQKKDRVFFAGFGHSDRIEFVNKLLPQLGSIEKNISLSITKYQFFKKRIARTPMARFIQFSNMTLEETARRMKEATIAIDIQHPTQNGLTMRTIEAVGAQTKLITTNSQVAEYDFYNPDNILMVDRDAPVIPPSFLEESYRPISPEIRKKYFLGNWIEHIFAPLEEEIT